MPKQKPRRNCEYAEKQQCPKRRSVFKHYTAVTDAIKGTDSDVRSIGEQAKTGEKHRDIARDGESPRDKPPDSSGNDAAENRAKPNND